MIQIIAGPEKRKCEICGTEFLYEKDDIFPVKSTNVNDDKIYYVVNCPICGNSVYINKPFKKGYFKKIKNSINKILQYVDSKR